MPKDAGYDTYNNKNLSMEERVGLTAGPQFGGLKSQDYEGVLNEGLAVKTPQSEPTSSSDGLDQSDYGHLLDEDLPPSKQPKAQPTTQVAGDTVAPSNKPVLGLGGRPMSRLAPWLQQHPYAAGAGTAALTAGLIAAAPEIGLGSLAIGGGSLLWNLMKLGLHGTAIGTAAHYADPIVGGLSKLIRGAE